MNVNIDYDSFTDYQPSNYPFRIIRYNCDGECGFLKFYKKDKRYSMDSYEIEKYILSLKKPAYKEVKLISDRVVGDERIVCYTSGNCQEEIHIDKQDKEYYYDKSELMNYLKGL